MNIYEACLFLAGRCDGVFFKDGAGFNKLDTRFGHEMADRLARGQHLTVGQCTALRKILPKYHAQFVELGSLAVDAEVPVREPIPAAEIPRRLSLSQDGKSILLVFPYDPALVDRARGLSRRRFDGTSKTWVVPLSPENFLEVCKAFPEFYVTADLAVAASALAEAQAQAVAASRAEDAEITVEGLGGELFPFQKAGVAYAMKAKRCFIADEPGLGKTIQALATIQATNAYPTVVVCPASLKLNWEREARKWLPGRTVSVLNGGKAAPVAADVVIINYDILTIWGEWLKALGPQAVVFDESHYAKNHKAKRTEACKDLAKGVPVRLALTGTPVLNRPQELLSQLGILGRLDDLGGFWTFAKRYCSAYQGKWGWDLSGAAHLDELNEKMRTTCFVRRRKADVLKELPAKQRATVPVELSNRPEYRRAEAETVRWLAEQAASDATFLKSLAGLSEEEQKDRKSARAEEAASRARQAEQLVRIEALKQVSARGKAEVIQEWVESFLETGEKLVIFAHHQVVVGMLAEAFHAPSITGQTAIEDRQAAVDRFQTDPDCRVIVCNIQAGGVGITLTAASNVAFVEFGWNPAAHDQAEDRCHRIGQTDQVTAWYLVGSETIDEDILRLVEEKRRVVDAATEGDAGAVQSKVLSELIAGMLEKKEEKGKK